MSGVRPRLLLSYWYARSMNEDLIRSAVDEAGADLVIDSGAFTAYNTGAVIDVADYAQWLRRWKGRATAAFALDVIGNPDASYRNWRTLLDLDPGVPVIPVFHAGSDSSHLARLIDDGADYVAFGGLVEHRAKRESVQRWAAWNLKTCREAGVAVHGLGLTASYVKTLPFYSVDSTSWTLAARHGSMSMWDAPRARIVQMKIRRPSDIRLYAQVMARNKISAARITAPGFGYLKSATYLEDREWMYHQCGTSFMHFEAYLTRRHHVGAPASIAPHTDPGTKVYLAAARDVEIARAVASAQSFTP